MRKQPQSRVSSTTDELAELAQHFDEAQDPGVRYPQMLKFGGIWSTLSSGP